MTTQKGLQAFSNVSNDLDHGETSYEGIASGNPCIERSFLPFGDYVSFACAIASADQVSCLQDRWSFKQSLFRRVVNKVSVLAKKCLKCK